MGFKIIHIEETDSTNSWLMKHVDDSYVTSCDVTKEWLFCFVVVAEYQTAGRGCGSNAWESEKGKNLTFSLLIHPTEIPANRQFFITEVTSVALCETLEQYVNKVEIKWPNDIYVDDKKICGMLIENRLLGSAIKDSIIGIGLNVNQEMFLSDAPNPVSLYQLIGKEIDREELLHRFLKILNAVMMRESVSSDYRQRLYRRTGLHPYKDATGSFLAKIVEVQGDGHLVLCDESGKLRTYAFKEIQFIL